MKFGRLLVISRPVFWGLTFFSYLFGMASPGNFTYLSAFQLFLFSFPLNLYLYGLNDTYDYKSDEINPRKGDIQGAVVKEKEGKQMLKIIIIPVVLIFCSAIFSGNFGNIFFVSIFVLFNVFYSHRLFRFKSFPFLDSITSTIIYFSPALAAYSLHGSITSIPLAYWLLLLPPTGVHAITTLKDNIYDAKAGDRTTGVVLGETKTLFFALITFLIPTIYFYSNPFLLSVGVLSICIITYLLISKAKYDKEFVFAMVSTLLGFWMLSLLYGFLQNV